MLDVILIAIAVGIVSRLAKSKGHPPLWGGNGRYCEGYSGALWPQNKTFARFS